MRSEGCGERDNFDPFRWDCAVRNTHDSHALSIQSFHALRTISVLRNKTGELSTSVRPYSYGMLFT
jgi:hypothetical protein